MKAQIIRLPLRVDLFDDSGVLVKRYSGTKKSRARLSLSNVPRSEWTYGVCRVWYNRDAGFYNEFEFKNINQFDIALTQDTEWALLEDFTKDGTLDKSYLGKKKVNISEERRKQLSERMKRIRKRQNG